MRNFVELQCLVDDLVDFLRLQSLVYDLVDFLELSMFINASLP